MRLKNINLFNFRNYSALNLELDERPLILVGNNAAGKSNLLEAIYFLSTTKSGRVDEEKELIRQGEEVARLQVTGDSNLEITLQNTQDQFSKKVKVNGIPRRVVDYIGNLPAVIFYPSDINMVTGSPSLRRWHLDMALAQVDPSYKKALTQYEQFLTARNRVLKAIREGKARIDELDYWTKGLVEQGELVSAKRQDFFEFINGLEKALGEFVFEYRPSQISVEKLQETNSREVAAAQTLIGPHRDDFRVILNGVKDLLRMRDSNELRDSSATPQNDMGRDLAHFGSRGEQRLATLAFKLATLEYMALTLGKRPILLLDDVFSELDSSHRAAVVEVVSRQQTILSAVELQNLPKEFLNQARILKVKEGKVVV